MTRPDFIRSRLSEAEVNDLRDRVEQAEAALAETKRIKAISDDNRQAYWTALCMVRDAVEELGPPGAVASGESLPDPEPTTEAEAIIAGVQKIAERAEAENARLREALETMIEAFVHNPGDGGPFEAGEVPALDNARAALAPDAAPGHTDLMVSPESLDAWLEANPPPEAGQAAKPRNSPLPMADVAPSPWPATCERHGGYTARMIGQGCPECMPATTATAPQGPVAWRGRHPQWSPDWQMFRRAENARYCQEQGWEVQPLYAATSSLNEAALDAASGHVNGLLEAFDCEKARAEAAAAENARLRKALEPFIREANRLDPAGTETSIGDSCEIWQCGGPEFARSRITYGDLRAARRAALAAIPNHLRAAADKLREEQKP